MADKIMKCGMPWVWISRRTINCAQYFLLLLAMYSSRRTTSAGMDYFYTVAGDIHGLRPAELIEAQKAGKKVFGTFCVFVPR